MEAGCCYPPFSILKLSGSGKPYPQNLAKVRMVLLGANADQLITDLLGPLSQPPDVAPWVAPVPQALRFRKRYQQAALQRGHNAGDLVEGKVRYGTASQCNG